MRERLSLAFDHLMFITRPDGTSPLYGDDDGGRLLKLHERPANDFRDTLAMGAALFDRGDWKYVAGDAPIETIWLLGPEALARYDQLAAAAPVSTTRAYSEGGYFVMRDGWSDQSSYAIVDCGPHGSSSCAHAHADALALEYAAEGRTWLVDPGTFTYTGDAARRDQFRKSSAHNTVTVDGSSQSVPAGAFAWEHAANSRVRTFISGEGFDYFEGSHDGYGRLADPLTHTRSLLFIKADAHHELPGLMVVRDKFSASGRHSYELRYHFAAGCSAIADRNFVKATDQTGRGLAITTFPGGDLKARIEDGWVSRCYGQREPAPVAVFEANGHGPQSFVSFIVPRKSRKGGAPTPPLVEKPSVALQQRGAATEGRPYMVYSVSEERVRDLFLVADQIEDIVFEQVSATGSMAWGRFINGEFDRGCLIDGNRFEILNRLSFSSLMKVDCCAFKQGEGSLEITIHGATRFDLSFRIPPGEIVLNGSRVDLSPNSLALSFALEGSVWQLADKDDKD
jgi:hypothetical protein